MGVEQMAEAGRVTNKPDHMVRLDTEKSNAANKSRRNWDHGGEEYWDFVDAAVNLPRQGI